ncbi:MAG: hypothetical protein VXX81_05250 [Pseudomonadota bacterium]|nr:hypothetical protein [Pseudomonadota bacterium]
MADPDDPHVRRLKARAAKAARELAALREELPAAGGWTGGGAVSKAEQARMRKERDSAHLAGRSLACCLSARGAAHAALLAARSAGEFSGEDHVRGCEYRAFDMDWAEISFVDEVWMEASFNAGLLYLGCGEHRADSDGECPYWRRGSRKFLYPRGPPPQPWEKGFALRVWVGHNRTMRSQEPQRHDSGLGGHRDRSPPRMTKSGLLGGAKAFAGRRGRNDE